MRGESGMLHPTYTRRWRRLQSPLLMLWILLASVVPEPLVAHRMAHAFARAEEQVNRPNLWLGSLALRFARPIARQETGTLWPAAPPGYNPPNGLSLNRLTGIWEGTVIAVPYVEPAASETFVDTGNSATNMVNLQATLNTWASSGVRKKLIIPAGTRFNGNLLLPVNLAAGWACLEVEGYTTPTAVPTDGTGLFIIESQNINPAVYSTTSGGVTTAHGRYAIHGAEIRFAASIGTTGADTGPTAIVRLGLGSIGQNNTNRQPDAFDIEGCYIHGWALNHCRRGIEWHASNVRIAWTRVDEIHNKKQSQGTGGDSQCIWGWNGSGPLLVTDCVLSGGDETFGTGGGACYCAIPSDQHYRRVRTEKPASMLTNDWGTKNHIEYKFGRRILHEQCYAVGFPTYYDNTQQTVFAWKVSNEINSTVIAVLEDVLAYNCGCERVPNMLALIKDLGNNHPTRMGVVNFCGRAMNEDPDDAPNNPILLGYLTGSPRDVYLDHIGCYTRTGETTTGAARFVSPGTITNFTLKNFLVDCNGTSAAGTIGGLWGSIGQGNPLLAAKVTGTVDVTSGIFIGSGSVGSTPVQLSNYPTGVLGCTSYSNLAFVDTANNDYTLQSSSPAKGAASDGSDFGPHDYTALMGRLAAVPS